MSVTLPTPCVFTYALDFIEGKARSQALQMANRPSTLEEGYEMSGAMVADLIPMP